MPVWKERPSPRSQAFLDGPGALDSQESEESEERFDEELRKIALHDLGTKGAPPRGLLLRPTRADKGRGHRGRSA